MFTQDDAWKIAKKLKAKIEPGRKHELAVFWHDGKRITQYGIRRGSKNEGHDYLPSQLFVSPPQCRDLSNCPLSLEDYVKILRKKKKIPETPKPTP